MPQAELNEANASRRELAERVELKNDEIAERNKAAEDHLAKLVAAQEERSRVEAQLRDANNKQAAFESAKARMEQQQNLLQQHNEWLRAELTKKSDELLTARKAASADALAAANELEQFKKDCASAVRDLGGAKEEAARASAAASRRFFHTLRTFLPMSLLRNWPARGLTERVSDGFLRTRAGDGQWAPRRDGAGSWVGFGVWRTLRGLRARQQHDEQRDGERASHPRAHGHRACSKEARS